MGNSGQNDLSYGAIGGIAGDAAVHLCVDMQRLFAEATPWHTPWMPRILPQVRAIAERHVSRTVFTRFMPPQSPRQAEGAWRRYYLKWAEMTLEKLDPALVGLVPELAGFAPPAEIFDKAVYSPWLDGALHRRLRARGVDTLVVTGGETDVCVLSTVTGAVDLGYRVIVARDAVCSAEDETHDAILKLFGHRLGQQIELADTENILCNWAV